MPVDVKGRIVYNPDEKDGKEYMLDCKQLGIEEEGSGVIEEDIEDLRSRVTDAIVEEFHVAPAAVQITGYTLGIAFSIEGPTNHTLDDFVKEKKKDPDK